MRYVNQEIIFLLSIKNINIMKKMFLFAMLAILGFNAMAQISTDYESFRSLKRKDHAMDEFLFNNDYDIYKQFHKGLKIRSTGKKLVFTGLGLTCGGLVVSIIALNVYNSDEETGDTLGVIGVTTMMVGSSLMITSIPFNVVGKSLKRRAVSDFEEKYFHGRMSVQPSLDLNFTGNGLGLAFRF